MTNPAKQDDIIHWHNDINNLISIFMETKLKGRVCPWIINKFDSIRVFTSGLDSGYLGAGVVIIMNSFLVKHVCKISEVPGWLLSIKLLFKNKLSVLILGLYAGASLVVHLVSAIVHHDVLEVDKHYDMDHQTVSVSIGLDGLLDAQLNFLRKQANKDH
ncbi:hypothetical protein G9A89_009248 [Geosiphon pyriformis]|nr:hypothetical protein G9A89_009248 [Geosiphon pyriformis]